MSMIGVELCMGRQNAVYEAGQHITVSERDHHRVAGGLVSEVGKGLACCVRAGVGLTRAVDLLR